MALSIKEVKNNNNNNVLELKSDEKYSFKPKLEKSWYGYILHCFSIFAMLHKCPRVENHQIFSLTQIPKKKNRFGGQKCDGSWQ